jgi:antitoxin (DNA-binding transcriptional repressor) of toxin-antitoxin stability system
MKQNLITTHEAKTHLSKYLTLVTEGAEILISRGKEPIAKLVSIGASSLKARRPKVGVTTSLEVTYSNDCFSPLDKAELKIWGI